MAASTEVIREYLTKIGYVTNAVSQKKAEAGIVGFEKKILSVGGAVAGLVASVSAATAAFAYSMRKMYYQSELSDSSVKNIKGMGYAFEQLGGDGEALQGVVQHLAQILRMNPGMKALSESLGVKVTGRDTSDVAMDLVKALSKMEHFAGAKFAEQFGIDEQTFYMLKKHMGEIYAKRKEMGDLYKEVGFDPDSAKPKKVFTELTAHLDRLEARASLVGSKLLASLASPLHEFMRQTDEGLNRIAVTIQGFMEGKGWATFFAQQKQFYSQLFGLSGDQELPVEKPKSVPKSVSKVTQPEIKLRGNPAKAPAAAADTRKRVDEMLNSKYGITIKQDKPTTDSSGAQGKTPVDKRKPGNSTPSSASPVGSKAGLGAATVLEAGVNSKLGAGVTNNTTITQTNHVSITGVQNPREVGKEVESSLNNSMKQATRNARGANPI